VIQDSPFIRLSLIDASDSAAGVNAWMRSGATVADGESAAATLTSVVGALSDAQISARFIVFRGHEEPRPVATGTADSAGAGVFVFTCSAPDTYAIVIVPAIRSDLLVVGGFGAGVLIDQSHADVIAFRDAVVEGGFSNPFGLAMTALVAAFYQWRP
jgi:hypothetical protein